MGVHVVLTGPSGAGKTSLILELVKANGNYLFTIGRTWKTRPRRPGETDEASSFISPQELEAEDKAGRILFAMPSPHSGHIVAVAKQAPLSAHEIRLHDIPPPHAARFCELVPGAIVVAVEPIEVADLSSVMRTRDPFILPNELTIRLALAQELADMARAKATIIFKNTYGLTSAAQALQAEIVHYIESGRT